MPALLVLLKLIPLKDWFYGGIIIILLAGFGWYTHHERVVGQQKMILAQAAKNKEKEDGIEKSIEKALDKWKQYHPVPPPAPVPRLVCHSSGVQGSGRKGTSGPSNDSGTTLPVSPEQADGGLTSSTVVASDDAGFDPAPAVSSTGIAADTEIVRLKAKVTLLQDTIKAYQNGGLVEDK